MSFWADKRVLVTGGAGFLGTYVVAGLKRRGASHILVSRSASCDLRLRENCRKVVQGIDIVIHLAARVGGIQFNQAHPGQMVYDNLVMGAQLIDEARLAGVKKVVNVGSACCYPASPPVPFKEDELWNGYPTPVTAPYGLAKRMLLVQSQTYRAQYGLNAIFLIPTNLYGPGDHFDPEKSHVIPSLVRKFVTASDQDQEEVVVWGSGQATREFLYVEDAAEGILLAAEKYDKAEPVNLGSGVEMSMKELAGTIAQLASFQGRIVWDTSKPEGQLRRSLDTTRAREEFGFQARTSLWEGLQKTIDWYREQGGTQDA